MKNSILVAVCLLTISCNPNNPPNPNNPNNNPVDTSIVTLTVDGQTHTWKAFADANSTGDETALITDLDYEGLYVESWHSLAGHSFGMNFRKGASEQPSGTYSHVPNGNNIENDVKISFLTTNGVHYFSDSTGGSITIDHFDWGNDASTTGYGQGTFTSTVIKSVNGSTVSGSHTLTCTFKVYYKDVR